MKNDLLRGIRLDIFRQIHDGKKRFNALKNSLNIEGNELSYHLKILLSNGLIERKSGKGNCEIEYSLSEKGKEIYPYLSILASEQKPLLVITSVAVIKGKMLLLHKKPREPEKGKLIFFGGKADAGLKLEESAKKQVKEQSGLNIYSLKLRCINEFVQYDKNNTIKHNWVVYFYTALAKGKPKKGVIAKDIKEVSSLDLYGDNIFFLKKMLKTKYVRVARTDIHSGKLKVKLF